MLYIYGKYKVVLKAIYRFTVKQQYNAVLRQATYLFPFRATNHPLQSVLRKSLFANSNFYKTPVYSREFWKSNFFSNHK